MGARLAFLAGAASAVALLGLAAYLFGPVLACGDACLPDYEVLRGPALGKLETPDARLNAWILGWVHHALLDDPASLFDANVFYPARNALAGSEHMLGVAVLLLPLRAFGVSAVGLHQAAIVLSALLLAATTWALARWLTASRFAALVAAAAALCMPWRVSEASHVQLLNAQWFPLVWLLVGRIAAGDRRRRTVWGLAAAVSLQVLSSFYLAYFLLFSLAVLVGALWIAGRLSRDAWLDLLRAGAVPAILLGLAALPYLRWRAQSGFVPVAELFDSVRVADAWSVIGPRLELGLRGAPPQRVHYEVPLVVFAFALYAGARALFARGEARSSRVFVAAFWAMALGAFVLALGREVEIGGTWWRFPAHWASLVVPGFDTLRNPLRWAIVIGLAFPPLAAVGVAALERAVDARGAPVASWGVRAAVVTLLLLSLPTAPLPAKAAWRQPVREQGLYRAVEALPPGAVIEIPWPLQAQRDIQLSSGYMLGSTLHWKPIANGTSGYAPASYRLLRQVAQRLPHPDGIAALQRLVDARWIVVHGESLLPAQRAEWEAAARDGRLRPVLSRDAHRIFEIPAPDGRWMEALRSAEPRARTLAGLARDPLALAPGAGRIAVDSVGPFQYRGGRRIPQLLALRIENHSDTPWPGLDPDPEGLVRLRYTFEGRDGFTLTETAALTDDLPAGRATRVHVPVLPPRRAGELTLRLELVQRLGEVLKPLPVEPAATPVTVIEAERHAP